MSKFIELCITYISSMFIFALELKAGQAFFIPDLKKRRKHFAVNVLISLIISIETTAISVLIVKLFIWNFYTNVFIYLLIMLGEFFACYLVFDYKLKDIGIITVTSIALQHIIYQIYHLTFEMFGSIYLYIYFDYGIVASVLNLIIFIAVSALLYFISYHLLSKKFRLSFQDDLSVYKILIVSVVALLISIVMNSFGLFFNYGNFYMLLLTGTFSIVSSILILFIIFSAFTISRNKRQAVLIEAFYKQKVEQYKAEKINVDLINIKCHDLKKQIAYLTSGMNNGTISQDQIDDINRTLSIYDSAIDTGNNVIDVIIKQKKLTCDAKGVVFTTLIDGKAFSAFPSEDIYSLFINVIDNAIEAVEKLDDVKKKVISITAKRIAGFIVLEEMNYFKGEIKFNRDGSIKTTKGDDNYHGFGTKSIINVAEKYHGSVKYDVDGDIVKLKVTISCI